MHLLMSNRQPTPIPISHHSTDAVLDLSRKSFSDGMSRLCTESISIKTPVPRVINANHSEAQRAPGIVPGIVWAGNRWVIATLISWPRTSTDRHLITVLLAFWRRFTGIVSRKTVSPPFTFPIKCQDSIATQT